MPMLRMSRDLIRAVRTNALGELRKIVLINGFRYGSVAELKNTALGQNISASEGRTASYLHESADGIDWFWRGNLWNASMRIKPENRSFDRDGEMSIDWSARSIDGLYESFIGGLAQQDVRLAIVQPGTGSTADHGTMADSIGISSNKGKDGRMQTATAPGSIAGQQWTLSFYVAALDPYALGLTATVSTVVRVVIRRGDDTDETSTTVNYTGAGKYQRLSVTKTFSGTAGTSIKVIIGPKPSVGDVNPPPVLLVSAVQLEQAGSATSYERTSETAAGTKNILLGSHFPGRSPWTSQVTSGQVVNVVTDAGRGPEMRAIVPTPGTMEFGAGIVNMGWPDGQMKAVPVDNWNAVAGSSTPADKFHSTAANKCGIYKIITGLSPAGKTYVASAWVRHIGSNAPTNVGILLAPQNNVGTHLYDDFQEFTPTKTWRRIWWITYVDPSYSTADRMEVFFFSDDAASGKDTEWFGFQLEQLSGDTPQLPTKFEYTSGSAGARNMLQRSTEADNGYWSTQNVTITANTGAGPIDLYNVYHDAFGLLTQQMVPNCWVQATGINDTWTGGDTSQMDFMTGQAYSIGAYGSELLGTDGDFTTWGSGTPNGFTRGGTSAKITQQTTAPYVWIDDEEAGTPSGVAQACGPSDSAPQAWLERSMTLSAGWHTIRVRVQGVNTTQQGSVRIAMQRGSDSKWLDVDLVRFRQASATWIRPPGSRDSGNDNPSMGVQVWWIYIATGGTYVFRIGALIALAQTATISFDQLRIWTDAGALYASTDRTETAGNTGWICQGLNVRFHGVVDDVTNADDGTMTIRCLGYASGTDQRLPVLTTRPECQWKFRGTECGYVSTTTFTAGAGPSTGPFNVADLTNVVAGRYILVSGSPVQIASRSPATGGGAGTITTVTSTTVTNGMALVYADCRKVYSDCSVRQRTHEYSGYRATMALQGTIGTPYTRVAGPPRYYGSENGYDSQFQAMRSAADLVKALTITGQDALNNKKLFDSRAIPIIYGRKSIKLLPIESHALKYSSDNSEYLTTFYAMGFGELEGPRTGPTSAMFFGADGPIAHNPTGGVSIYWHPGLQGEDAWWTQTDHLGALATQKIPNQRRDFRTNTDTAYSRIAYAILQIRKNVKGNLAVDLTDPTKIIELWADLKGRKVYTYDSMGIQSGSTVWSRNPVWILVDLLTNRLFGPGFPAYFFDWANLSAAAATCDATITSSVGVTTLKASVNSKVQAVVSVTGFAPEMACTVNGVSNTVDFIDPINSRLFFRNSVNGTAGWTVQGTPARYTCDLAVTSETSLKDVITMILATCRGLLTLDGGRIGITIQSSLASAASGSVFDVATPTPAAGSKSSFRGVVPDSVRYDQRRGGRNDYNVMEVSYESGALLSGAARTARFTDADMGGLDFPRKLALDMRGCDTEDQAIRCGLAQYAKLAVASKNSPLVEEPRALTVVTGPAGLFAQIGDPCTVVRSGHFSIGRTRIRGLTLNPDWTIRIETMPEAANVRAEGFLPTFDPYSDTPYVPSEHGSALSLATLTLTVVQSAAGQLKATVAVSGYAAGPGTSAGQLAQRFTAIELHASETGGFTPATGKLGLGGTLVAPLDPGATEFIWNVPTSLLEVPLYFRAVGYNGLIGWDPVQSAEASATTYRTDRGQTDPTQQQVASGVQMVYDGDFKGTEFADGGTTPGTGTLNADGWSTNTNMTYTRVAPSGHTTPAAVIGSHSDVAWVNPANTYDNNVATNGTGTSAWDGVNVWDDIASILWSFAAATKTGRGKVVCHINDPTKGNLLLQYTTNGSTWTTFAIVSATSDASYYTPRVISQAMANFKMRAVGNPNESGSSKTTIATVTEAQFDEETAGGVSCHLTDDHVEMKGDGTNYAIARRRFPGKSPGDTGTYLTSNSLNTCRLRIRNHVAGVAANDTIYVKIEDENSSKVWTILTVPGASVGDAYLDFANLFDPGVNPISGRLDISVWYKGTNTIDVDWLGVARGEQITAFNLSSEEQQLGRHPDIRSGETKNWPRGSWSPGVVRNSTVG